MIGTLSSIFIAAPITELMDRRLFSRSEASSVDRYSVRPSDERAAGMLADACGLG